MIEIRNLKKTYDKRTRNAHQVLHGMSFTLPDTGFICILGQSGCGKTSLLNAIGGLDAFDSGHIITENTHITRSGSRKMEKERNAHFGYIFQNYYLLSEHSVAYNIYLGMHSMPLSKKEKMQRVRVALEKVDMFRYRKRPVGQLSGGQQQRVAIARAIAKNPKVIFADEPTGNLDEANTMNICSILKELSKESLVVMVTHEERIAKFFADRIITIEDGRITNDTTDWQRGVMDAGEKGAIYAGEYQESHTESEGISLRLLSQTEAAAVQLTVITEKDRIIIKTSDPRVVLCSEVNASPRLIEGDRPLITVDNFSNAEAGDSLFCPAAEKTGKRRQGLGISFLLREAKSLVSSRRLGKIGTVVFLVLLSVMLSVSVADLMTVANINPEDFIHTDSHVLEFAFHRGPDMPRTEWDIGKYIKTYMEYLESSGLDFDYVSSSGRYFIYKDYTVPQLGELELKMQAVNYAHIDRLDPSTVIHGRMPERSDEIVIDRWLIDKYLEEEGILQNIIPSREYFIGKKLANSNKSSFSPTIVGICDSGEPVMYLSTEILYSLCRNSLELMSFSEFCEITGYSTYDTLEPNECIALPDNAGKAYITYMGTNHSMSNGKNFYIKDAPINVGHGITAGFVVADEIIENLYIETVSDYSEFSIWCADKEAMKTHIATDFPKELEGMLEVSYTDRWEEAYKEYEKNTNLKFDARTIVTATVFAIALVMLYLMQRSKINEHMDVVTVYRLLGVPKLNLLFVFAVETTTITLKYALPSVFLTWLGINALTMLPSLSFSMIYPLSAAALTLLAILVIRLLFSVLPVLRLLYDPPAKLAASHDF